MMARPRLLDLFCSAGGAARGYRLAGFHVTGVDIRPQPRYAGDVFIQADALTVPLDGFAAIHASPPCQAYSTATGRNRHNRRLYADLIGPCRERLAGSGALWVMENVVGAPLCAGIVLCGSMFGLDVRRHRLFESSVLLLQPACAHGIWTPRFRSLDSRSKTPARVVGVHGHLNYAGEFALRCQAMDIDWMTTSELSQAVPPAYTRFIGQQLMTALSWGAA